MKTIRRSGHIRGSPGVAEHMSMVSKVSVTKDINTKPKAQIAF